MTTSTTYDFSSFKKSYGATDFTIECHGETTDDIHIFKIHKQQVLGSSRYLDMLINSDFQESQQKSAQLQDDPAIVATFLWFMYGWRFTSRPKHSSASKCVLNLMSVTSNLWRNPLLGHMMLFQTADTWDFLEFQQAVRPKIRATIRRFSVSPQTRDWIKDNDLNQLKEALAYALEDSRGLEKLWKLIAYLCHQCLTPLAKEELCNSIPTTSWHLCKESLQQNKQFKSPCCDCQETLNFSDRVGVSVKNTDDNSMELVYCSCGFRGLCSQKCEADPDFTAFLTHNDMPFGVYCETCLQHTREFDVSYASKVYRTGSELKLGMKHIDWLHHCTVGGKRWVERGMMCGECRLYFETGDGDTYVHDQADEGDEDDQNVN